MASETVRLLTAPALRGVIGGALAVATEPCVSYPTQTTCPYTTPVTHTRGHDCGDQ